MTELVECRGLKVALSCRLFGHTRQAWYQSKADIEAEVERERLLLDNVREIRQEDPRIGCYKLWLMLCNIYGRDMMMGRDSFFTLLRRHGLIKSFTLSTEQKALLTKLYKGYVRNDKSSLFYEFAISRLAICKTNNNRIYIVSYNNVYFINPSMAVSLISKIPRVM